MSKAEEYFMELAQQIPDVKLSKMFGSPCLKLPNGKSGAMLWKDNIVVKLDEEKMKKVLKLKGTQLFEPMAGKPMKEWVQIPFTHKNEWKSWTSLSVGAVSQLKARPAKKKK